jgi:hypothetical protein
MLVSSLDWANQPISRYDLYSHANYLGWAKVTTP